MPGLRTWYKRKDQRRTAQQMTMQPTIETDRTTANAWNLAVGPDICRNVQAGLDHEWYITNGLGGYAAGSLAGAIPDRASTPK